MNVKQRDEVFLECIYTPVGILIKGIKWIYCSLNPSIQKELILKNVM